MKNQKIEFIPVGDSEDRWIYRAYDTVLVSMGLQEDGTYRILNGQRNPTMIGQLSLPKDEYDKFFKDITEGIESGKVQKTVIDL
jgi:hypothetical protein